MVKETNMLMFSSVLTGKSKENIYSCFRVFLNYFLPKRVILIKICQWLFLDQIIPKNENLCVDIKDLQRMFLSEAL